MDRELLAILEEDIDEEVLKILPEWLVKLREAFQRRKKLRMT